MTSFNQLQLGESARVSGYGTMAKSYRSRLLVMGLTPNARFTIVRVAPLGCPVEIEVRGSYLSLRRDEASELQCERL